MVSLPRLVIAAPASGHGKTTVATGLMAALRRAGHRVSGHKVGPDYIDPGYHALATGRPGRNLDPHLCGEALLNPLLLHGARDADLAVIEGVMGLYDGRLASDGDASTAHVAAVTGSPVVLVVDISHASRTVAAVIHGLRTWSDDVDVVGVILNKAGSTRHADEVLRALEPSGLPVLGVLHRDDGIEAPSRHLGLVPADERADAAASLDRLATQVAEAVDLEHVVALARQAPPIDATPWHPGDHVTPVAGRPVVAMAGGRAFTFRYAETAGLLTAAGCEVVTFDPTRDEALPPGTSALYLGGGFPEMHAEELSANLALRSGISQAVRAGLPTVAECAGLLYLCRSVDGHPMAGAIDADAAMAPRLTLAYREATAPGDTLLTRSGERVTGHEFHRTTLAAPLHPPAWEFAGLTDGHASSTLHAGYLHTHWAGHPQLAQRFAEAAAAYGTHYPDPLRHHGDAETAADLVDLAVNVHTGARPPWLDSALADSLAEIGRYPDATEARHAIAARHHRDPSEVLPTAGVAEAFGLISRLRDWQHPTIVHPQFTEPDVALRTAGLRPEHVILDGDFTLDPASIPDVADLVIVGNPTNPTGVRHCAATLRSLVRPGRLLVIDEAFCDDEVESLAGDSLPGLLVLRSLTKLWSLPGIRAGYALGDAATIEALRLSQTPWSVSTPAIAAMLACAQPAAVAEAAQRASEVATQRAHLEAGLDELGIHHISSSAAFVLARPGVGVREALRHKGFAVRRADTFPGLDASWVRIAVRPEQVSDQLLAALADCLASTR